MPAEGTCSAWGAALGVSQLLLDVFSSATSTKPPQNSCAAPVVGPASLHRAGTSTIPRGQGCLPGIPLHRQPVMHDPC